MILIGLLLIHHCIYAEEIVSESDQTPYQVNSSVIRELLQEATQNVFSPRSMELSLLEDHSEMIPLLAQWQYNDWHSYDKALTVEKLVKYFEKQPLDGSFTIVVLKDGMPIGSISLDKEGEPEFSEYSGPWLNSFHVIPKERGNRVGPGIAKVVLSIAKRLGYEKVNFFTSNFSNVAKYVKNGAQVVDTIPWRGHTVTIFKMSLESL